MKIELKDINNQDALSVTDMMELYANDVEAHINSSGIKYIGASSHEDVLLTKYPSMYTLSSSYRGEVPDTLDAYNRLDRYIDRLKGPEL